MAWRVYRSTDVGAPVVTTDAGMVDLLTSVLTGPSFDGTGNAYGSTPCAGWSRLFSGTSKSVVIPPASVITRRPYRISIKSSGYLRLIGYDTMSSVDTGADPFPPVVEAVIIRSSPWIIIADERTCVVLTFNLTWWPCYFGEFVSVMEVDTAAACVIGQNIGSYNQTTWLVSALAEVATFGVYAVGIARNWNNEPNGIAGTVLFHCPGVMVTIYQDPNGERMEVSGIMQGLNPVDGKLWYSPIHLYHSRDQNCLRGRLRGLFAPLFRTDAYTDGTTFDDGPDLFVISRTRSDSFGGPTRSTLVLQLNEPQD